MRTKRNLHSDHVLYKAATPSSRKDLDDFVASLVGTGHSPSSAGVSARTGAATPSSPLKNVGGSASEHEEYEREATAPSPGTTMVNRADGEERGTSVRTQLKDVEAQTEIPESVPKEKVYYTKETQTTAPNNGEYSPSTDVDVYKVSPATEEAIRRKVLEEQELEKLQREETVLREQEEELEKEIEQGLRELTADELGAIYGTSEFVDFVEQSSKVVERALTDSYDYLKDYTLATDRIQDQAEDKQLKNHRTFWDEDLCKGRSITDIDWSTKHPELLVASYSRSNGASSDVSDGLVLVWNLHLADRPEFVFHAQTDVLSISFSPFHPNLVIGGTYSGQILIWDTRAKHAPVLKSPLSAAGHTHPVYSMQIVGTQNANNLITASTDGTVCSWMLDMLARPQETVELLNPSHPKTDEVSVSCIGFPNQETTSFWVGTEEGNVYTATRYDRAGWKAGLDLSEVYRGHAAPITSLHFHPLKGPVDFSDLFLTSSMDWTCRLWRLRNPSSATINQPPRSGVNTISVKPLISIEEAGDYVYDVSWHTVHPALFTQVDGSGRVDLFNLNSDIERPLASVTAGTGRALNKVRWDKRDGRRLATGGADGRLYVYDVGSMAIPREEEWVELQKTLARLKGGAINSSNLDNTEPAATSASLGSPSGIEAAQEIDRFAARIAVR